ncbi:MAG: MarR family transcriptional regulator [Hydrogenophilales bacterium]|tara:strand:+ start:506 stop:946 length:441 start_codon:yes stop_codon:yes gene_type:complete
MKKEDLSRNFGFLISDVARLMRKNFDSRVKEIGLTRSQWWLLNHLFRADGITQAELAETLEIERSSTGKLLDSLELKGWIKRVVDKKDRRSKRVFLTKEVEPIIKKMRGIAKKVREVSLGKLSSQQDDFVDMLIEIKNNLTKDNGK